MVVVSPRLLVTDVSRGGFFPWCRSMYRIGSAACRRCGDDQTRHAVPEPKTSTSETVVASSLLGNRGSTTGAARELPAWLA